MLLLLLAVPTATHVHGQTAVYDWADGYPEVGQGWGVVRAD